MLALMSCTSQLKTLRFMHDKGYVYQDLKPANVMFGLPPAAAASVYLCDMGCVRPYVDLRGNLLTSGGDTGNDLFRAAHAHGDSGVSMSECVCVPAL